jgi:hypothetical protein
MPWRWWRGCLTRWGCVHSLLASPCTQRERARHSLRSAANMAGNVGESQPVMSMGALKYGTCATTIIMCVARVSNAY